MTDAILSPQEAKWAAEAQAVGLTWLKRTGGHYSLFRFDSCGHEQEIQVGHVRRNILVCRTCISNKRVNDACAKGLTLLEASRKSYWRYRFNNCGHEQEIQPDKVRRGAFKCHKCVEQKLKNEAELVGLKWLKQTRENYGLFQFNSCGHEKEIANCCVRDNNFRCHICLDTKRADEAAAVGLTWLKQTRWAYGLFRFNECNHEQEFRNDHVQKNNFRCRKCLEEKWESEAHMVGLTWIKSTSKDYGLFRFNCCGHEQEITNDNARKNTFACQTCGETWATRNSNLYIHVIEVQGEQIIKVGISRVIARRATQYGLPDDAQIVTPLIVPFETGKLASDAETKVLRAFKHAKHPAAEHFFTKSGQSECFRPEFLSAILEYCKSLQ